MNPEELLAHSDFVHALAHSLVLDENAAADLEQQTWLAAMEHPPSASGSRAAWLSKVIRNFARMMRRGEQRRTQREQSAARPEHLPSSDEIVEMMETRRRLIDAVLALDDPYRTAIVLRYYEDLKPGEIARKLGLPVETVRTRIKRGIDRLRIRLDERYDGGRNAWCLALAPLAGLQWKASSATAAGGTMAGALTGASAALPGVVIMSLKLKAAIAAAVVLGMSFAVWQILGTGSEDMPLEGDCGSEAVASAPALTKRGEDSAPSQVTEAELDGRASAPPAYAPQTDEIPPEGVLLLGAVTDKGTGNPVDLFHIGLWHIDESDKRSSVVNETIRSESGCFRFPLKDRGKYDLWLRSPLHRQEIIPFTIAEDSREKTFSIELDQALAVKGRVVEHATGYPVEGAVVKSIHDLWYNDELIRIQQGEVACCTYAVTDADGQFLLCGLSVGQNWFDLKSKWQLAAAHPDYAEGQVTIDVGSKGPVEIRLEAGCCIYGSALDDHGKPAPDILISMVGDNMRMARGVVTGPDGSYRSAPVRPGRVYLHAAKAKSSEESLQFTEERRFIDMRDSDVEVNFGPASDLAGWHGTFFDVSGNPVPDGRIRISPLHTDRFKTFQYNQEFTAQCDEKGYFEIHKLLLGTYAVRLIWTTTCSWGKITFDVPGMLKRDIHLTGGRISGVLIDSSTSNPLSGSTSDASVSASSWMPNYKYNIADVDDQGRFEFQGLPAGTYSLSANVGGHPMALVMGIELKAGGTRDNIRIKITPGGRLIMNIQGFSAYAYQKVGYCLRRLNAQNYQYPDIDLDSTGALNLTKNLPAGEWTLQLDLSGLGFMMREFEIRSGETTRIDIREKDFISFDGTFSVSGTLSLQDGAPVADALISFCSHDVPGFETQHVLEGKSGADGSFLIAGLRPGLWGVVGRLANGDRASFGDFFISTTTMDPYPLTIVLPDGEVSGTLFDRNTGHLIEDPEATKFMILRDAVAGNVVSKLKYGHTGSYFRLIGVPEGEYELTVRVLGYKNSVIGSIKVAKGQALDLGNVGLDLCGILNITVIDDQGDDIESISVFCDGVLVYQSGEGSQSHGKRFLYNLPLGKVIIKVSVEGCESKQKSVTLIPGETAELDFKLESL